MEKFWTPWSSLHITVKRKHDPAQTLTTEIQMYNFIMILMKWLVKLSMKCSERPADA